jgi:hypothetical protein
VAERVRVAAFHFEPDSRVLEPASSDDLADPVGDPLGRPWCAAARSAAAVSRLRGTRRFHASRRLAPKRAADGAWIPDRIRLASSAVQTRLARLTLALRHRQALPVVRSRQVGVAGIAWTDWVCLGPGAVRSPVVQASSGIDCRREPQRSAIPGELASPARCPIVFRARHRLQAFPSLYRGRAEEEG